MKELLNVFLTFAKIGLFTFGGGYAMIPIIEDICVEKNQWITHEEMMNITVIAESTPGPIAINCATYVGYRRKGVLGSIAATFGVVLPSFVIIFLIAMVLDHFLEITWIANAFKGIKIAVGILILDAAIRMIKKMQKNVIGILMLVVACVLMLIGNVFAIHFSTIVFILVAAVIALLVFFIQDKKGGQKQ